MLPCAADEQPLREKVFKKMSPSVRGREVRREGGRRIESAECVEFKEVIWADRSLRQAVHLGVFFPSIPAKMCESNSTRALIPIALTGSQNKQLCKQ